MDKAFVLSGTASLVAQDFGFWSDSQGVLVAGAAADISFDGTNVIPLATGAQVAFSDHLRSAIWVRGVGATVTVIATSRGG